MKAFGSSLMSDLGVRTISASPDGARLERIVAWLDLPDKTNLAGASKHIEPLLN
jgi:hypothetical protein